MGAITKIKLPDNNTYDINDVRISGIDSSPTLHSNNLVTSGGVAAAIINQDVHAIINNTQNPSCPDPCIWKGDDGYFYIKSTGRISPFTVKRTLDFVTYEDTGRTFISSSAMSWINDRYEDSSYPDIPHYWAPQVVKIGENWVLYLAIVQKNGDDTGKSAIVALTSKTYYGDFSNPVEICISDAQNAVTGPYTTPNGNTGVATRIILKQIIDPYVYCDTESNKIYMLAGSSYGIYRFELENNGLSLASYSITLVAGKTITADPTRATVCEGAFFYSKVFNGKTYYYLFASTGDYRKTDYRVVVGRSSKSTGQTNPNAPYAVYFSDKTATYSANMRAGKFEIIVNTDPNVLQYLTTDSNGYVVGNSNGSLWGPGHMGGIIEDNDGKTYIIYHCHNSTWDAGRLFFVQELLWDNNGWPYVGNSGHPVAEQSISRGIISNTAEIISEKYPAGVYSFGTYDWVYVANGNFIWQALNHSSGSASISLNTFYSVYTKSIGAYNPTKAASMTPAKKITELAYMMANHYILVQPAGSATISYSCSYRWLNITGGALDISEFIYGQSGSGTRIHVDTTTVTLTIV